MREITKKGEITRAELQAQVETLLQPAMDALLERGIVVAIVAAPKSDPTDGKAVVASSAGNMEETVQMLAQSALALHRGKAWEKAPHLA